jgi:hypothetical protein
VQMYRSSRRALGDTADAFGGGALPRAEPLLTVNASRSAPSEAKGRRNRRQV